MFKPSQPIYTVAGIRAIEAQTLPHARPSLMERAGRAAATEAVRLLMDRRGPILVVCGPGNNAGDGFVMARHLLIAGRPVMVAFAGDAQTLPPPARAAHEMWRQAGGETTSDLPAAPAGGWALVVDALFGIGLTHALSGRYATWVEALNAQRSLRLALDIPSGLDADTGEVRGVAFRATHTVTFIALKPGLLTLDGPDHVGEVSVQRLEIDPVAWQRPEGFAIRPSLFQSQLTPRRRNTHKGQYGEVLVLGGDHGMVGAALLAGRAALHLGAGRVLVGLLDLAAPAVDPVAPELMLRPPSALLRPEQPASVIALGPGMGQSPAALALLEKALMRDCPLVLDADALNLIAQNPTLHPAVATRRAPTVLTPHPAEAARLLAVIRDEIQHDRIRAAQALAVRFNAHVVLKGCGSVIATPAGQWFINRSGHPGMASGGVGDVLTGLVAALIGQGWPTDLALIAAVHLHGLAADQLARDGCGPVGLTAGELCRSARQGLNRWIAEASAPPPA